MIRPEGSTGYDNRHDASAQASRNRSTTTSNGAIDDHIANPRDDVLSAMIATHVKEEAAPTPARGVARHLFSVPDCGLDTVTDSLDCFFVYLARHPRPPSSTGRATRRPAACDRGVVALGDSGARRRQGRHAGRRGRRLPHRQGRAGQPAAGRGQHRPGRVPRSRTSSTSTAARTGTVRSAEERTAAWDPIWPAWNFGWRYANSTGAYRITRFKPGTS